MPKIKMDADNKKFIEIRRRDHPEYFTLIHNNKIYGFWIGVGYDWDEYIFRENWLQWQVLQEDDPNTPSDNRNIINAVRAWNKTRWDAIPIKTFLKALLE